MLQGFWVLHDFFDPFFKVDRGETLNILAYCDCFKVNVCFMKSFLVWSWLYSSFHVVSFLFKLPLLGIWQSDLLCAKNAVEVVSFSIMVHLHNAQKCYWCSIIGHLGVLCFLLLWWMSDNFCHHVALWLGWLICHWCWPPPGSLWAFHAITNGFGWERNALG